LNHRFGNFADGHAGERPHVLPEIPAALLDNPGFVVLPFYWVPEQEVLSRCETSSTQWLIGFRDVTDARASARSVVISVLPRYGVGNSLPLVFARLATPEEAACFAACMSSLALDFAARFKIGGLHLNFFICKQLPILTPSTFSSICTWSGGTHTSREWLLKRILELNYTAWDLEAFARDCGWSGPPFRWNEERRLLLRCELDAAFFHLYLGGSSEWGIVNREQDAVRSSPNSLLANSLLAAFPTPRDAVSYIMDTFPIVRRKDEEKYGDYRTKRIILAIYDAMQDSIRTGQPYQTRLDPPPADPRCCHPPKGGAPS
jgi:hypothetical protein